MKQLLKIPPEQIPSKEVVPRNTNARHLIHQSAVQRQQPHLTKATNHNVTHNDQPSHFRPIVQPV